MNRLPRVLQNEIWEYVRGDRAFWKEFHKHAVVWAIKTERDCLRDDRKYIKRSRLFGSYQIRIYEAQLFSEKVTCIGRFHYEFECGVVSTRLKDPVKRQQIVDENFEGYVESIEKAAGEWDPWFSEHTRLIYEAASKSS
jgi:hypothetical protein